MSASELNTYVGDYDDIKIKLCEGRLTFQKGDQMVYSLTPFNGDTFIIDGIAYMRLKFAREQNGRASNLIRVYENGMERKTMRTR